LLLERLSEIDALHWIRFLYCYPNRITPRLLETIAAHPRLAKYMDIPLQHASKNVLARMKRGSHGGAFLKMLERIRRMVPGVSIRTSFIVGFPGETKQDFKVLCDFVREAEFDWMGVFAYSDEDTSRSYHLDGKVDAETIAERRDTLMAIQQKISRRKLHALTGKRLQALLEGPSKDTELIWEARLEGMAPEIDGKIYVTEIAGVNEAEELPAPGTMATIEITGAQDYDLLGRVIAFEPITAARQPAMEALRSNLVSISPALAR
jgi:ribosomal protein S12 methylthiotransferase